MGLTQITTGGVDDNINIDSNTLKVDGTNNRVGIGTAAPHSTLTVAGSGVAASIISSNDNKLGFRDGVTDRGFIGASATACLVASAANGSERMRIDSSGRLLVGTTSAVDSGATSSLQVVNTSTAIIALGRNDSSISAGNDLGAIRFYGNDGGSYQQCAEIIAEADGTHANNDKPTRLVFSTTADSGSSPTERMRIDSSGDVQARRARSNTAGDVALSVQPSDSTIHYGLRIDSTNNSLNLDRASGTATNLLRIDSSGLISQGGRVASNHGSPNLLLWGADSTLHITSTGSTNNSSFAGIKFAVAGGSTGDYSKAGIFVERQDSYNDLDMLFAFRSSNDATGVSPSDEKMRIDSDGKLNIGTTTATQRVSVGTSASETIGYSVDWTGAGAGQVASFTANTSTGEVRIGATNTAGTYFPTFYSNNSERMRIDSSGRVGIGTSSPSSLIHGEVSSGAATLTLKSTATSGEASVSITGENSSGTARTAIFKYDNNDLIRIGTAAGIPVRFETNDTERMRIASNGKVGIGTDNPGQHLTIKRTGGQTQLSLISDTNESGAIYFGDTASTNRGLVLYDHGQDSLQLYTAGSERMRITSDGRLLLGTTTSYGRIHADDFNMNPVGSTWLSAAYVASGAFGGGYALLDGSKGYSIYCADTGNDLFIQGHTSTTAAASGGVKLNDRATSWTSASDERQKQNLVPITGAIDKVKTLRTVTGNYEWAPDTSHAFLIAQDVQEVLPQAVSVMNKDAATEDQRLGLAYTETIPLLTAALKEAIAKIETLETKVAALEAAE